MRKMALTKLDIYTALLTLGSMIPGIAVYSRLPEEIAIHFTMDNQADGWADKGFAVFGIPFILTILQLSSCAVCNSDRRTAQSGKVNRIVRFFIPIIAYVVETMMILYSMEKLTDISLVMTCMLSVLMIVVGNYAPKTRQNSFLGIRTRKTLSDEVVWNKVHRLAGKVWTVGGIIMLILALNSLYPAALLLLMFVLFLVPIFYQIGL